MTTNEDADAFGYTPANLHPVLSVQVGEAKEPGTLLPAVAFWVRLSADERYGYALTPEAADALADELHRWAGRAREKHWE